MDEKRHDECWSGKGLEDAMAYFTEEKKGQGSFSEYGLIFTFITCWIKINYTHKRWKKCIAFCVETVHNKKAMFFGSTR